MSAELAHHATGPGMHEVIMGINTAVVIAIIYVAGKKGILEGIRGRSKEISEKLFRAKNELEKAKSEIEEARREMASLAQSKANLLKEVEEEGRRLSASLIEEAQHNADKIIADAQLTAANEVVLATKSLQQSLVKKSVEEAFQIVNKSEAGLKNQIHDKLVERFVAEVSAHGATNGR